MVKLKWVGAMDNCSPSVAQTKWVKSFLIGWVVEQIPFGCTFLFATGFGSHKSKGVYVIELKDAICGRALLHPPSNPTTPSVTNRTEQSKNSKKLDHEIIALTKIQVRKLASSHFPRWPYWVQFHRQFWLLDSIKNFLM